MRTYILRRLLSAVPVILGVSVAVFSMLHFLPGDPIVAILGDTSGMRAEVIEQVRQQYGLDEPVHLQYWRYVSRALQGDLGRSIRLNRPVLEVILKVFPSTLQLTVAGLGVAVVLGCVLGIVAAVRPNSWLDNLSMVIALGGVSLPSFWLGFLLIWLFAVTLGWLPITGEGGLNRLVLPALTLGFGASAIIARLVRSSMLEVLRQEYVTAARAKGLAGRTVILRHALKNAIIPVVTVVGLQFGALLGGAIVIEQVFNRQGIGTVVIRGIQNKDFPLVQGCVLFSSFVYVAMNLLVDLSYSVIDPRIRYGSNRSIN
jgi:peptide/nickel transport system permease protein